MDNMIHVNFRIRSDQLKFMKENGIERSPWIRQRLRDAIAGRRDYPIGDQRRNCSNMTRTSATIGLSQKRFIANWTQRQLVHRSGDRQTN